MKLNKNRSVVLFISLLLVMGGCSRTNDTDDSSGFSFIFMTDIHLQPETDAVEGFTQAIDTINKLKPAFVLTGGDMIMDAGAQKFSRADSLYNLYIATSGKLQMPLYNTLGNHELYGIDESGMTEKTHPEYGEKMFENRLGDSYYSFEYKGWKFMILNSVEDNGTGGYVGLIDDAQIEWIREELTKTDTLTPIVITTHIPFVSAYSQAYLGSTVANSETLVVTNSKDIVGMFADHNLKLVLQGHHHTLEAIFIDNIYYITGGAVCGAWWKGPNLGYEEGFILIKVKEDHFGWEYVDYGWEPKTEI